MKIFVTMLLGIIIPTIKYGIVIGFLWSIGYTAFICFRDFYNRLIRLENKMGELINYVEKIEDDNHVSINISASNIYQLIAQHKKDVDIVIQNLYESQKMIDYNNVHNNEIITENFELFEKHILAQIDKIKIHKKDIEYINYVLKHTQFQIDEIVRDMSPIKVIVGYDQLHQSLFVNKNITSLTELYKSTGEQPFHFHLSSLESFQNIKIIDLAILYKISLTIYTILSNGDKNVIEHRDHIYKNFNPYESLIKSNVTMDILLNEPTTRCIIEYIMEIRPDIKFTWSGMNISI